MKLVILIPTRNRCLELRWLLESIIDHKCADIEIVVSDNSDQPIQDAVNSWIKSYPNQKILYLRPPETLNQPAHWKWALSQVQGDYVGVFTDRYLCHPEGLKQVKEVLEKNSPSALVYSQYGLSGSGSCWYLQRQSFTGRLFDFSCDTLAEDASQVRHFYHLPCLLNCFVQMDILLSMLNTYPNLFGSIVADISFAMHSLDFLDSFSFLDFPVVIPHSGHIGIGYGIAAGLRSPAVLDFIDNIAKQGGLKFTPVPQIITNVNIRCNEYERVRSYQKSRRLPPLHLGRYYSAMKNELRMQKNSFPSDALNLLELFGQSGDWPKQSVSHSTSFFKTLKNNIRHGIAYDFFQPFFSRVATSFEWNPLRVPLGPFLTPQHALEYESHHPAKISKIPQFLRYWN
jgi:glycosyltransferase involved in cell wall biosynthesis